MTMATTTLTATRPRARTRLGRLNGAALDIAIFVAFAALCLPLFFQGGLEALLGAAIGAIIAKRHSVALVSGAFAGLFAGALFAGFFHGALVSLIDALT